MYVAGEVKIIRKILKQFKETDSQQFSSLIFSSNNFFFPQYLGILDIEWDLNNFFKSTRGVIVFVIDFSHHLGIWTLE